VEPSNNGFYKISYSSTSTGSRYYPQITFSTTGYLIFGGIQIEQKSYSTPFVVGTRLQNTNWYDLSYGGNNITLTNGPMFNSGGGGSIVFDGVDDYGVNTDASFNILENVSVNAWVKHSVGNSNVGNYVAKGYNNGYRFRRNGVSGSPLWMYSSTNNINGGVIYDNIWYMVSAIFSSSGLRAYINGQLVASNTTAYSPTDVGGTSLYIGTGLPYSEVLVGNIAITQIYNRALTPKEILQNYQSTFTRFLGKNIVTSGLVNYLDAGYNASYPGSGTTWNNISGVSGGTGTLVNGPTYSTDGGGSIVFDGIDDYVSTSQTLPILNTVSLWIKPDSSLTFNGVLDAWEYTNNTGLLIRKESPMLTRIIVGDGSSLNAVNINTPNGVWTNITIINDGSNTKVYTNIGTEDTISIIYKIGQPMLLGTRQRPTTNYWSGNIGQVQVYNRALSPTEILQNYQAQLPTIVGENFVTNGLVLYLDAGYRTSYPTTGTTWNNVSGVSGGTGTLTNGPTYSGTGGGSIVFDGVDDFVQGTISSSTFTGPHTICCWFYRETVKSWSALFSNNVNTTSCSIFTFINATNYLGTNQVGVSANSISVDLGSDHLNKWIYGVITYGGNSIGSTVNVYAYKDGNLITVSGGLYWNMSSASSFYVGRHYSSEFQIHDGLISNVSVYNRTLTSREILQNYNATKSRYGL
jgi:hypothetical protein